MKYLALLVVFLFLNVIAEDSILPEQDDADVVRSYPIYPPPPRNHSFADIVEPLLPSVVSIYMKEYSKNSSSNKSFIQNKSPVDRVNEIFERLKIPLNFEQVYVDPKSVPLGSGFIIDPAGYIVTNYHVIDDVDKIYVKLTDNTELSATLVGSDKKTDLALLKVESNSTLPFVKFGDSANARIGDWIIAIGNPFGSLGGTVTTGIISSKGRDIDTDNMVDKFIQTDAAINTGNSGGPMFNLDREVIGINTSILSPAGTNIGIGFAIPSNTAEPIIERLKQDGKVHRGKLGVIIQELTDELSEGLGLEDQTGVLVVKVEKDSPGEKAGIKSGDLIIEFAGQQIKNKRKLQIAVAETPVNQEIKIVVLRNGKTQELICKLSEDSDDQSDGKPNKDATQRENPAQVSWTSGDITFSNITDELKKKFTLADSATGIITLEVPQDLDEKIDLKVGDLVIEANNHDISNINELKQIYQDAQNENKQNIILLIERENTRIFVPLPVK